MAAMAASSEVEALELVENLELAVRLDQPLQYMIPRCSL